MKSLIKNSSNLQPNIEIFGLSGSPRINGNSDILLKNIISGVNQENVTSDYLNLTKVQFQGCIGCEKCRKDQICTGLVDGMSVIYNKIISSKGLVLVSPTHNYNVTSWMKAFIDRLYCFYHFENDRPRSWSSQFSNQGRKAVIAAICEQESIDDMGFTLAAMKKPLTALGYEIIGELSVFKIFDKAKVKDDKEAMEKAYQLGRDLACAIK
ncbi:flavodoxin family protein [Desulfobacter hydrogenophilus]|uniref:Flavodoxin family protein n=1 Tax=Desulfobacter hydrogenophilus TaxID=2291 RepID=A0A328FER8_9BACT|nr:flavodoxin family protein [Desulfobacter hydrogenophilus]NDY74351.1 flavodoxin family protein [Desulfobacter hydrogenophilus]QBH12476.1 flavodoxin family protein [Desulfobacter hydrogenophilus]RAM01523.1 flavodoxin family protein [Desulfobacter hydrogenophilus]